MHIIRIKLGSKHFERFYTFGLDNDVQCNFAKRNDMT